jgi:hypothetical protein
MPDQDYNRATTKFFEFCSNLSKIKSFFSVVERQRTQRVRGASGGISGALVTYNGDTNESFLNTERLNSGYSIMDIVKINSTKTFNTDTYFNVGSTPEDKKTLLSIFLIHYSQLLSKLTNSAQKILNYRNQSKQIGTQRVSTFFGYKGNNGATTVDVKIRITLFISEFKDLGIFYALDNTNFNDFIKSDSDYKISVSGSNPWLSTIRYKGKKIAEISYTQI